MSKYLKLFETQAQYEAYLGGGMILPNVSYCEDNNEVHYNPYIPPRMDIITYEASEKLKETTSSSASGLHKNAFSGTNGQLIITTHTFENGVGTIEFNGDVISIGDYAFDTCTNLTSIIIPDSVTSIGEKAFRNCSSLTSVIIPNSVTSIGSEAFRFCSGLTSIVVDSGNTVYDSRNNCNAIINTSTNELIVGCKNTIIPNSVTSIGGNAFRGCSNLTSINIPDGVTSIGASAFNSCSGLTSVTIPDSVTSIGDYAFGSCYSLTSITIGSGVTSIGGGTFSGCTHLTSVTIPDSVTSIGSLAFNACSVLTSVTIGSGVTSIGEKAFYQCTGLTNVIIPNSVTSIGNKAFYNCTGLTNVTIGSGVTSIGDYAFGYCSKLTSITSLSTTAPIIINNTFQEVKTGGTLTVPSGSTGYNVWMGTGNYYLGKYNWTKVEQ